MKHLKQFVYFSLHFAILYKYKVVLPHTKQQELLLLHWYWCTRLSS